MTSTLRPHPSVVDPIEEAIARAALARPVSPSAPAQRVTAQLDLAPGRAVVVNVPADLTDAEIVEFIGSFTGSLRTQLRQARPATPSRLLLPGR